MFIKYIFNTMKEKKIRFVVILLSVCITAALLYIILFANQSVSEESEKSLKAEYGNTDLIISSTNSDEFFLFSADMKDSNIKESVQVCQLNGAINKNGISYDVSILGLYESDYNKILDLNIIESAEKDGVIVSKRYSEKNDVRVGDKITVTFNQTDFKYEVVSIAENVGFFYDEFYSSKIIMSMEEANKLIQSEDKYTVLYCDLEDNSNEERDRTIERLNEKYSDLEINIVDESLVSTSINSNLTIPLLIILVVGCIMSFLILYTTANIILYERIPVIGTFLSIGLTQKRVIRILLLEALIYGVLGGLIGLGFGIIAGELLINNPSDIFSFTWLQEIHVNFIYGLVSVVFATIISLLSIYVGVKKIKKIQIKSIILNQLDDQNKGSNLVFNIVKLCFPLLLVAISFLFYGTVVYSALVIVAICLVVIVDLPLILKFLVCKIPLGLQFKTPYLYLAFKNVGTTKMLMNNMKLIVITLSITLLVSTISTEVITGFDGLFEGYDSDVTILMNKESEDVYEYVESNEEVKNYYYFYSYNSMKVKDSSAPITLVQGIELDKYMQFNTYFTYDREDILSELDTTERNILLSWALLDKYGKQVGDSICLETPDGGEVEYKIAGSFNAKMAYLGSFALISIDNMKKDFGIEFANSISIKLKDGISIQKFYNEVKKNSIISEIGGVALESDKKEQDIAMTSSFLGTIENISLITIILAAIGILNNIVISFIQRKKVFAVYDSIGISRTKKMLVMLYESIVMAIICVVISYLSSYVIIDNVDGVLRGIGVYINITFNQNKFLMFAGVAVLDVLLSCIAMMMKIKKMSIIDELRYE